MADKKNILSFDDITEDGRLWAVRYEGDDDNILDVVFAQWDDVQWLRQFFKDNLSDLQSYFKISAMQEREHTLQELLHQEQVRNFLLSNNIIDTDSFVDYLAELS